MGSLIKAMWLIQLSVLLLNCFVVRGNEVDIVSWTQAPASNPSYPPVGAPQHHKGHHKKPNSPPSKLPVEPPSQPPVHPPTQPPAPQHHKGHHKKPNSPPSKSPVAPPVHPPTSQPPVHPPTMPPSLPVPTRKFVAVQGVVYCKSCKYTGVDTLLDASPLPGAVVKLQCNNTKRTLVQEAKTDKNGYFFIMAPKNITTFGSHKCKVSLLSSPMATCNKTTNLHYGLKGAILIPSKKPPPAHPLPFNVFTVGPFAFEHSTKCHA